jgi:hypothetical protein
METEAAHSLDRPVDRIKAHLTEVGLRIVFATALLVEHTIYVLLFLFLVWVVEHAYRRLGLELQFPIPTVGLVTFEQGVALFDYTIIVSRLCI